MKYSEIGKSGLKASLVAIGAFGLGGGKTWSDTKTDAQKVALLFDKAVELGVNVIDTAPVYGLGDSENLLGNALKGKRQNFILQTKCALNWRDQSGRLEYERDGKKVYRNLSAQAVRGDLEDSLKRLKTDYIDIYITHRQSDTVPLEETMGELLKLKDEGKIRAIGISQASHEILEKYTVIGPVALVQEKLSILSPGACEKYIPTCEKLGVTFQVFASLEAGALTGPHALGRTFPDGDIRRNFKWFTQEMYPHMAEMYKKWEPLCKKYNCSYANLAQAWTLNQSPNINLLIGVRQIESLVDTVKVLDIVIEQADIQKMYDDCDYVREQAK